VLHALSRVVTYQPWVDGDPSEYAQAGLFAILLGAASWVAIRGTIPHRSSAWLMFPWVTLLIVGIPSDVFHYLRFTHPVARSGQLVVETRLTPENFDHDWIVERGGGATVEPTTDGVVVTSPPGGVGYLDLLTPDRPDPRQIEMSLPRGLYVDEYEELLEWDASITLENAYFVVVQTKQIQVQVAPFGLHITYPNPDGRVTEHHVEQPLLGRGGSHHFQLERAGGQVRLKVDQAVGWVSPDAGKFGLIRFGESRPDALHGGRLALSQVRYVRRFVGAPGF
jgi:hypothetical protein